MSTKSKASEQTPTQAREQAEATLIARRDAHQAAVTHAADLRARLGSGDEAVSSADLLAADADVERWATLEQAAERALEEAQIAEQVHVAEVTARELTATVLGDQEAAKAKALKAVNKALETLRRELGESNEQIRTAIDAAKSAGLTAGQADPLSPVVVESERMGNRPVYGPKAKVPSRDVLILDGERYQQASIDSAMRQVTTEALADQGVEA